MKVIARNRDFALELIAKTLRDVASSAPRARPTRCRFLFLFFFCRDRLVHFSRDLSEHLFSRMKNARMKKHYIFILLHDAPSALS